MIDEIDGNTYFEVRRSTGRTNSQRSGGPTTPPLLDKYQEDKLDSNMPNLRTAAVELGYTNEVTRRGLMMLLDEG